MNIKLSKIEWIIFIGFGILLFFIPYLFTRQWGIFPIDDVGGTIGGVTSPFLGFFGSILVYLALKAQVDANKHVQKQFKKEKKDNKYRTKIDEINFRINTIKDEINNFTYLYVEQEIAGGVYNFDYKGSQAVYILLKKSKNLFYGKIEKTPYEIEPKLLELKSLLVFLNLTIVAIIEDKIIHDSNKKELFNIIDYVFESKLRGNFSPFKENVSIHNEKCPLNCGSYHGIPSELFELYYDIERKIKIYIHAKS